MKTIIKLSFLILILSAKLAQADQIQFVLENVHLTSKDKNYSGTFDTNSTANPGIKYRLKLSDFHIEAGYKYLTLDKNFIASNNKLGLTEARLVYRFKPSQPSALELSIGVDQNFSLESNNGVLAGKILNLTKVSVDYFKALEEIDELMMIIDAGAEYQKGGNFSGMGVKLGLGFGKDISKTSTMKLGYRFKYNSLKSDDLENQYKTDQFYILFNF